MKLINQFKMITIILSMVSAWKLEIQTPALRYAYRAYFILYRTYLYPFLVTQVIQIYIGVRDVNLVELFACFSTFVPYIIAILKLNLFRSNDIQRLLANISRQEDRIMNGSDDSIRDIYKDYAYRANRSYVVQMALAVDCITLYCMFPKVPVYPRDGGAYQNVTTPRFSPISSYLWFDKYENIKLTNAIQSTACSLGALWCGATDAVFYGFLIYSAGQIRILQHLLENIYEYAGRIEMEGDRPSERAQMMFTTQCIVMYQQIIRDVATLDKMLRNFMLFSFLLSSFKLAIVITQTVQLQELISVESLSLVSYLGYEAGGLYYNYWYANEISIQSSEGISVAIFKGRWYECSERVKKALLFTILRSRRPCKIGIGPFYDMDLTAVINILRACYGYLALMNSTG